MDQSLSWQEACSKHHGDVENKSPRRGPNKICMRLLILTTIFLLTKRHTLNLASNLERHVCNCQVLNARGHIKHFADDS